MWKERIITNLSRIVFNRSTRICRVEIAIYSTLPATSIQEQKYAVYRILPLLESGTAFATVSSNIDGYIYHKNHFLNTGVNRDHSHRNNKIDFFQDLWRRW